MSSLSMPNPPGTEPSGTHTGSGIGVSNASTLQLQAYDAGNAFVNMTRQTQLPNMLQLAERTFFLMEPVISQLPGGAGTKGEQIKTKLRESLAENKKTLALIKANSLYKGATAITGGVGDISVIIDAIRDMANYNFETKKWGKTPTDVSQLAKFVRTVILRDVLRPNANAGNNTLRSKSPGNTEISALFAKGGANQQFFLNCQNVGLGGGSNLRISRYDELNKCIIETYEIMSEVPHVSPPGEPKDRYATMITDFMNFNPLGRPENPKYLNNILKRMHDEFPGVIPDPSGGGGGGAAGGAPPPVIPAPPSPGGGGGGGAGGGGGGGAAGGAPISFPNPAEPLEIGDTLQLTPTIPGGETVTYTSSATEVATVDSVGLVTPVSPGRTTITGTLPGGQSATVEVTVPAGAPPLPPSSVTKTGAEFLDSDIAVNKYYLLKKVGKPDTVYKITNLDNPDDIKFNILISGKPPERPSNAGGRLFLRKNLLSVIKSSDTVTFSETKIPGFEIMSGGARKTRNRKMNRRRKTGKKVKPSPLKKLSSQQLF